MDYSKLYLRLCELDCSKEGILRSRNHESKFQQLRNKLNDSNI